MMNFTPILEYQKIDIELKMIVDEINKSEDNRKLEQARTEFNAAKIQLNDAEKAAENIVTFYNNAVNYFEDNSKRIDDIEKAYEIEESEEKKEEMIQAIETIKEKFTDLEKKLAERKAKSDSVIKAYLEAKDKGTKLREIYSNIKNRIKTAVEAKTPKVNELKEKLAKLKPSIDKVVMSQYEALTADKKYPAFVPCTTPDNGKSYSCGGCGLRLSQKENSELVEKGFCRCETCRRIIYKN